jgi:glycerol kinase
MTDFGTISLGGRKIQLGVSVVDQQASLYGHECREIGEAKITFGTGAFALVITGPSIINKPEKGLLPTIAWQSGDQKPVYALEGGVYCASSALNWAKSLGLFSGFADINQLDAPPAITRDLAFVTALTGLGCPHWDGSAAGLWIGMTLDTTPMDMVQAILEGVALRAAQVVDAMDALVAIDDTISIDGGMSANPWFCQFLADVLQKTITVQKEPELTALGTAMMAGDDIGVGSGATVQCTTYNPRTKYNDSKSRFSEAVSRCREWRTPS